MIHEFTSCVNIDALSQDQRWMLFQSIVSFNLCANGYIGDAQETASSLDMSFDEVKDLPFSCWLDVTNRDLIAYKRDCPYLFDFKQH